LVGWIDERMINNAKVEERLRGMGLKQEHEFGGSG
jgi:hypothetical protein